MSSSGSFGCWCVCVCVVSRVHVQVRVLRLLSGVELGLSPVLGSATSTTPSRETPLDRDIYGAATFFGLGPLRPMPSRSVVGSEESRGPLRFLSRLGLSAELQIRGGLEEARVAVLLHQGVDFGLGQVEGRPAGVLQQLLGDGFCRVVQIDLGRNRRREHRDNNGVDNCRKLTGQMSSRFVANHLPLWAPPLR